MIVVSDSSPLIALHRIGQLDLLGRVFVKVLVPDAVRAEYEAGSVRGSLSDISWVCVERVLNVDRVTALLAARLDLGEAEAVALAEERHADYVLIDERLARTVARRSGLRVMGLFGVLLLAKDRGILASVRPVLEGLVQHGGFHADEALVAEVLRLADE